MWIKTKGNRWSHSIDRLVKYKMCFAYFCINFEELLGDIVANNPSLVLIAVDFNVRSSFWWKTHAPFHMVWVKLSNSYSSEFIFLYWSNLYKPLQEKVLYLSLHRKCHHRITFSKLNLKATAQWPSQDFKGDLDTDYIWVFISFYVNAGIGGPKKPSSLFPGVG